MTKDIYIAAWERLYNDRLDAGWSEKEAEKYADDHAYDRYRDMLGDMADAERLRRKEQ